MRIVSLFILSQWFSIGQSRVMNENASKHMLNTFHISFVVKGHSSNHTRVLWHTFIQQNVVDANMNK